MVYYLLDNVIWFLNVGVVSKKVVTKSYWKEWKDIFNLLRNYTQIFRSILLFYKVYQEIGRLEEELKSYNDKVVGTTCLKATELMRNYINLKQKMYEHMFVIIRNILRSLMLNFKLKYEPWKTIFHPILISFFGLIQNITALFKIWMK